MKISDYLARVETDKIVWHNYGDAYDALFSRFDRSDKLNILEIGTQKGGSLCAWQDYFPNATVTGIDIVDVVKPEYRREGINYVISDIKEWKTDQTFDIIIDDGSHFEEDVRFVIENYQSKLNKRGVMIVEDIQNTNLWDGYDLVRCGVNYDDVLLIIRK